MTSVRIIRKLQKLALQIRVGGGCLLWRVTALLVCCCVKARVLPEREAVLKDGRRGLSVCLRLDFRPFWSEDDPECGFFCTGR